MVDQLTEEQISEFKLSFAGFDKDGDGTITTRNLYQVVQAMGYNPSIEHLADLIYEVDGNQGIIDFPDYIYIITELRRQAISASLEVDLANAFRIADVDHDGLMPVHDIRHALAIVGQRGGRVDADAVVADIVGQCSAECLSLEEFVKIMMAK